MNLVENSKILPIQISKGSVGSLTALCLILSGCATTQSNSESAVAVKDAVTSNPEERAKTSRCEISPDMDTEKTVMVLKASGGIETRCPLGTKIAENSTICLNKLEKITLVTKPKARSLEGPGCFFVATGSTDAATSSRLSEFIEKRRTERARTGAVRGTGSKTKSTKRVIDLGEVKVIRGSASALKRYELKATIPSGKKICLKAEESLTVLRKKGGVLNLRGPGCNVFRRSGKVENVPGVSSGS